jgi:hypothetical protein
MELVRVWVLGKLPRGNLSHLNRAAMEPAMEPYSRFASHFRTGRLAGFRCRSPSSE